MIRALFTTAQKNRFLRNDEGSVIPIVGLSLLVLVGTAGAAIDMGRLEIVQARMQNALDTAGLAAGATISTTNAPTIAQNYFNANFPATALSATVHDFSAVVASDNMTMNLSVKADVPTVFMKLFHQNKETLTATSQITRQSSGMELVLVLDNSGSMNKAVNPANSSTTKIVALQQAAATLLTSLYGSGNTVPNLWVGVVPFTQTVNIGTGNTGWLDTSANATTDFGPTLTGTSCQSYSGTSPATSGTYSSSTCSYTLTTAGSGGASATFNGNSANWGGCVMARTSPYDTSDDVPSSKPFLPYVFPYTADAGSTLDPWRTVGTPQGQNCTTSHQVTTCTSYKTKTTYSYAYQSSLPGYYGTSLFCPKAVQGMVAEKNTITSAINSLTAGGSTTIDLGLAWGYRMLSPNWRGLWGGEMNTNKLPLDYKTPLMNKVIILMTDGMNEFDPSNYTGYKYLDSNVLGTNKTITQTGTYAGSAEQVLDNRTLALCTALKANGVIIYTIGFGTDGTANYNNSTSVNGSLLQSCASQNSYYFLAPTNAQLQTAFKQIGDSLANLRISK